MAVACSNSALPSSGNLGEPAFTDGQGHFEFFVPPGRAYVYVSIYSPYIDGVHRRTLIVPNDRDPEPVVLKAGTEPDWSRRIFSHDVPQIQVRAEQAESIRGMELVLWSGGFSMRPARRSPAYRFCTTIAKRPS